VFNRIISSSHSTVDNRHDKWTASTQYTQVSELKGRAVKILVYNLLCVMKIMSKHWQALCHKTSSVSQYVNVEHKAHTKAVVASL